MIADLEGFIDRRAAVLAAPLIEEARAEVAGQVAAARHEVERKEDLIAEYRRQVKVMERQLDAWQDATGSLNPDAVRPADDPAVTAAWSGASLELLIRAAEFTGPDRRWHPRDAEPKAQHQLPAHGRGSRPAARGGPARCWEQHDRRRRRCAPGNLRPPDPNWPGNSRPEPTSTLTGVTRETRFNAREK
jgi:hypothetical protein